MKYLICATALLWSVPSFAQDVVESAGDGKSVSDTAEQAKESATEKVEEAVDAAQAEASAVADAAEEATDATETAVADKVEAAEGVAQEAKADAAEGAASVEESAKDAASSVPAGAPAEVAPSTGSPGLTAELSPTPVLTSEIQRSGIYFGLGLSYGLSTMGDADGTSATSGVLFTRLGYAIQNNLLVGVEAAWLSDYNTWGESEPVVTTTSSIMAQGTFFPMKDIPLSLQGGLGWGSALRVDRVSNDPGGSARVLANGQDGVSWMAAVGYDFFAGEGSNLGLGLRYDGGALGDIDTFSLITAQLSINFY
ncbi:MAG: outer membrane beta-barrel protein [Myxococcota bacterium]